MSIGSSPFQGGGGAASIADATETTAGKIRIATSAEAATGTNDLIAMTPLTVKERIDASLVGAVQYQGTFNATAGTPSLANAEQGDLYIIDTAGTIYGASWSIGDHLLINADMGGTIDSAKIDKVDNTNEDASETVKGVIEIATNAEAQAASATDKALVPSNLSSIDVGTLNDDSTYLKDLIDDTTPELGGNLITNGFSITSTGSADVILDPDGLGEISVGADVIPDANETHYIGSESERFVSAYTNVNGAIQFKAKNDQGASITKGQAVYIKGVSGTVPTIGLARANSASTMPAFGLALADANDQAEVQIVTFGNLTDYNTTTYSLSANQTVYVSAATAGALTNTAPTGESNLIQNIGRVVRADASAGIIKVGGAGRSNATPNLDQDKIFVGNASNQAVSTALSAIDVGSFNDDSTYQPLDAGLTSISGLTTSADKMIFTDGSDSYATTDLTAFARSLLDDANATTARSTLSLGTAATSDSGDFLASTAGLNDLADVSFTAGAGIDNYILTYDNSTTSWGAEAAPTAAAASETTAGVIEIATNAEAQAASATDKALVPSNIGSIDTGDLNDDGTYLKNLSEDTTPQLGADLDVNGNAITSASNGLVEITPNGTGAVKLGGNTNPAELRFFDEAGTNYVALKAPADASISADETFTLPATDGTNGQVLQTNGSGVLSFVDQSGGGGGVTYSAITADPANAQAGYHYSCTGTFTITLATSGYSAGDEIRVKNMGTGTITIDPQTGTIDGSTTDYTLDVQYSAITLVSTGTNWEIV